MTICKLISINILCSWKWTCWDSVATNLWNIAVVRNSYELREQFRGCSGAFFVHNGIMKNWYLCIYLLQSTLRFVIPYLVKKASPSSSAILRHVAKELKMNRREMLLENFKFIFSFLVRSCSPSELEKALGYVQVTVIPVSFFFARNR